MVINKKLEITEEMIKEHTKKVFSRDKKKYTKSVDAEMKMMRMMVEEECIGLGKNKKYFDKRIKEEEERLWNDAKIDAEVVAQYELLDKYSPKKKVVDELENDLEKMWYYISDKVSAGNEEAGKRCLWTLFSVLMKKAGVKINKIDGRQVTPRLHFFWIQPSRSGKDRMINFLVLLIDKINELYMAEFHKKLIWCRKVDNADTVETMVNFYKERKNGKKLEIDTSDEGLVQGIFEQYDLLYSPECSFLFVESRHMKSNTIAETMLQALEGTPLPKRLIKWNGAETITKPNFCYIGASRKVGEHQKSIIESGLQQRGLSVIRNLSTIDREKMIDKFIKYSLATKEDIDTQNHYMNLLANKLFEMYKKMENETMDIVEDAGERRKISEMIGKFLKKQLRFCEEEYPQKEHVDVGQTFVMGLENLIITLAYKNALLDETNIVDAKHFEKAFEDIAEQTQLIMTWIEDTVEENKGKKSKRMKILRSAQVKLMKGDINYTDLVTMISNDCDSSKYYTRDVLYSLARAGKIKRNKGTFSLK